ncbi:MAG TPA: cobalamin-binding protein [Blastocatellia bacterium]|nr:cobalamin-binding protein [Blastocatellia bacterium]
MKNRTPQLRIVSLIASATEIVCALGFEPQLVGRSHECDYPPSVKGLSQLTAPKLNITATSGEIDRQVKQLVQQALSVYRVDAEALERLRPTHIITQTQCEVCAVSLKDVEAAVCEIVSSRPQIVALEPNALADVWSDIHRVAAALDAAERGEALVSDLRQRMEAIHNRSRAIVNRPTVACVEWIEPLMAAGNWMPELVEMAGGRNLFGQAGKHSPWMTWDELVASNPEVLFVSPCGFDIPRTIEEMHWLCERREWHQLSAVQSGRVFIADGNQYFHRPGPRLAESLEILAEMLHPQVFHFGYEGTGWIRFAES